MSIADTPTEQDWGNVSTDNLDVQAAFKDFFGKTNEEMKVAFARSPIEMADSLRWMPEIPFRYYIKGFADCVASGAFHIIDAPDVASTFLGLIEEKLRAKPDAIAPVMSHLLPVVQYLSKNQQKLHADPEIYGDFGERGRVIEELWEAYAH